MPDILELLSRFVDVPSHVGEGNPAAETAVAAEVERFFAEHLPAYAKTSVPVDGARTDLLFLPEAPSIIFCCHLDTVPPSRQDHAHVTVDGDKASGLGTKDMKAGWIAALLAAYSLTEADRANAGFLFYCDEEYGQEGMLALSRQPALIPPSVSVFVSPESRFNLAYGCRGFAVLDLEVTGKRAHTSRAHQGVNAGERFFSAYDAVATALARETPLGTTTTTLVGLRVGIESEGGIVTQGNAVPDLACGTLSLRISDPDLTQAAIETAVRGTLVTLGIEGRVLIKEFRPPSSIAGETLLAGFTAAARAAGFEIERANPGLGGYNDVAILSAATGVPFLGFGPYGEGNHGPDEWVSLQSIADTRDVLASFIRSQRVPA